MIVSLLIVRERSVVGIRLFVFALCALSAFVVNSSAQDWKTVANGVEYAQVRREFNGKAVDINLLRLDLKKVRLDVHHALDKAIGLETTSSIAKRKGAIAAINAGFFRLDKSIWAGDSAGALTIDCKTLSEPLNERVGILIFDDPGKQTVIFSHLQLGRSHVILSRSRTLNLKGINRERLDIDDVVAYTPEFHRNTLTNSTGVEAVISKGRVKLIVRGRGNALIPNDGWVLSATGKFADEVAKLNVGQAIGVPSKLGWPDRIACKDFETSYDVTNGVPQLIKNGRVDITWEQEKASKSFVETRHPRTAVAKLKDGKFLMLTADGRTEQSAGLDLYDLANYMLSLGATDAMNLDGGGSTTMYLDGKVVNRPSDKDGERKVGDAIVVTLRKKR